VVDGGSAPSAPMADHSPGDPAAPSAAAASASSVPDDEVEDLADFDADNLEVAEIDNSAEARLLQAFPGAEEVV